MRIAEIHIASRRQAHLMSLRAYGNYAHLRHGIFAAKCSLHWNFEQFLELSNAGASTGRAIYGEKLLWENRSDLHTTCTRSRKEKKLYPELEDSIAQYVLENFSFQLIPINDYGASI